MHPKGFQICFVIYIFLGTEVTNDFSIIEDLHIDCLYLKQLMRKVGSDIAQMIHFDAESYCCLHILVFSIRLAIVPKMSLLVFFYE